ncbi:MAG: hypothetical protein DRO00_08320 [Thermoproteota archaeon]|nr:MAG: hypothetical protein DRO00_08320 [Candidatus Korarchaeota archaeon]
MGRRRGDLEKTIINVKSYTRKKHKRKTKHGYTWVKQHTVRSHKRTVYRIPRHPLTKAEIDRVLKRRKKKALAADRRKTAKTVFEPSSPNATLWAHKPEKYDLKGIDTREKPIFVGLHYTSVTGKLTMTLSGNTYPIREFLRRKGFRWLALNRQWGKTFSKPEEVRRVLKELQEETRVKYDKGMMRRAFERYERDKKIKKRG